MSEPEDTSELFAEIDKIKVEDGLEFDPLSLRSHQFLERTCDSPAVLFDEPVPWRFWKKVAHRIRKMSTHFTAPELRESREAAVAYCRILVKNRVNALTPFRAQQELHDIIVLRIPEGTPGPEVVRIHEKFSEALRAFKDAVYIEFMDEYLARKVG